MPSARSAAPPGDRLLPGVLLTGVLGALAVASVVTLVASPDPATGVVTTAVVTTSVSCTSGGQDQVAVRRPGQDPAAGTVDAALDACGQPDGSTVSVQVAADGSIGPVVTLAGTRSPDRGSGLPVLVLSVLVVLTSGAAAVGLTAGPGSGPAKAVGAPV